MDALGMLSRFQVGVLITSVLWVLYGVGVLQPIFSLLPIIIAVPAIFTLSEIIRRIVENRLGKRKVPCNGEYVLITGCGSGFGYALTKILADKGWVVRTPLCRLEPAHEVFGRDNLLIYIINRIFFRVESRVQFLSAESLGKLLSCAAS